MDRKLYVRGLVVTADTLDSDEAFGAWNKTNKWLQSGAEVRIINISA